MSSGSDPAELERSSSSPHSAIRAANYLIDAVLATALVGEIAAVLAGVVSRVCFGDEKYGIKTIILARCVPLVRTFCPPVTGAARMSYSRYLFFDVIGGILWVWSMTLIGYSLGVANPHIDRQIHWVIAGVIFVSLLPAIISILRARAKKTGIVAPAAHPEKE